MRVAERLQSLRTSMMKCADSLRLCAPRSCELRNASGSARPHSENIADRLRCCALSDHSRHLRNVSGVLHSRDEKLPTVSGSVHFLCIAPTTTAELLRLSAPRRQALSMPLATPAKRLRLSAPPMMDCIAHARRRHRLAARVAERDARGGVGWRAWGGPRPPRPCPLPRRVRLGWRAQGGGGCVAQWDRSR